MPHPDLVYTSCQNAVKAMQETALSTVKDTGESGKRTSPSCRGPLRIPETCMAFLLDIASVKLDTRKDELIIMATRTQNVLCQSHSYQPLERALAHTRQSTRTVLYYAPQCSINKHQTDQRSISSFQDCKQTCLRENTVKMNFGIHES